MKEHDVPQDSENSTYGGEKKLIYAINDHGDFVGVKSSGWEAEAEATRMALALIRQQCDDSWARAKRGETAVLEYYMCYRRMDLALLAQTTGLFQWRIRRHLRPATYSRLGHRTMARYAQALALDIETLKHLPDSPLHDAI